MGDDRRAFACFDRGNIINRIGRAALWMCKWAIIIFLFVVINKSILGSASEEFLGKDLFSDLVANEAEKKVDNLQKEGFLAFGPYASLTEGTYTVTLYYHTDEKENYVDVVSGQTGEWYYKDFLDSESEQKSFELTLEEAVSGLEIRTYYMGKGLLEVEKITIKKDVSRQLLTWNILLALLVIFYEVKVKKLSYEKKFACGILLLLCLPMALGYISESTGKQLDLELEGNFDTYTKPEFEIDDFISREYQSGYENWWNGNFVPRGYVISAYNQLRYSLFDLGNRIIGKENSIYEEVYLADVLCMTENRDYSIAENQAAMQKYVEQLESISNNLNKIGKKLLVYTTLNKAAEQPENIPDKYLKKYKDESKIRAIDYFRSIVGEYDFSYIDTSEILNRINPEYPVFYKTGIHWSRPFEQEVSREILNVLRESGVSVGTFETEELQESSIPYWRDADVYEVLNVFNGTMDPEYYEYETSIVEEGTANILIQGGSFGLGFKKDFIENLAGTGIVNLFYNQYVETPDGRRTPISTWEEVDLASYITAADAVIIEINEHVMYAYSDGFVEYLSGFLDGYVEDVLSGSEMANKIEYDGNLRYGFHDMEVGYRWTEGEAKVKFVDADVASAGLEIEFIIPNELSDAGTVEVVVNGVHKKTVSLGQKGKHTVVFSPEELQGNVWYDVVISTSDTFVPKEEGMSADERVLGIQVFYVGEKR